MSHTFIPADESLSLDPAQTLALKRWSREALGLRDDVVITISEMACRDAGCPLLETVVTVFDDHGVRLWKFTRPKAVLTKAMVMQTLATPPQRPKG